MSDTEGQSGALIGAETVRELARVAELPLAEERLAGVAPAQKGRVVEANLRNP
jgi:hypothetical protein